MCYDVRTNLEAQLIRAKHYGNDKAIKEPEEKLRSYWDQEIFHSSGFAHQPFLFYTNLDPEMPVVSRWGLVPRIG